jgi:hypothetical protein
MHHFRRTRVIGLLLACGLSAAPRVLAQDAAGTRTVYVSVTDKRGPVLDVPQTDFSLKEDGKVREIVKAAVSATPLEVAILVDDDDQGGAAIRAGIAAFVKKVAGRAQVAVITTRGGITVRQDFATDSAALAAAAEALPLVNSGLSYLPLGLLDVGQSFAKRASARPVIVAIATPGLTVATTEDTPAGPVASTRDVGAPPDPSSPANTIVLDALRQSHSTFYVLQLDTYSARGSNNEAPEYHYAWPVDAPAQSGGRTDRIVAAQGLVSALERIADELLGQYAVTYRSAGSEDDMSLNVDVKRRGVSVHAPRRVY